MLLLCLSILLTTLQPPRSPLFPYTTLFRSVDQVDERAQRRRFARPCRPGDQDETLGEVAELLDFLGDTQLLDRHHLRSEEHTSELQSLTNLVCRLLLEKKKKRTTLITHYKT